MKKGEKKAATMASNKVVVGTYVALCMAKNCPNEQMHAVYDCFVDENDKCVITAGGCTRCGQPNPRQSRMHKSRMTCFNKETKTCPKREQMKKRGHDASQEKDADKNNDTAPKRGFLKRIIARLFGR